ncbi:MAG TPA: NADH-ubiquinone oxidoreductase-F iron-sulfur binding region domain-containing protein [Solirubrobacteraceae bacterium]|jgi:NADH:ubiquinone oxidoreductase subunit F (NADH-binding)
MSESPATTTEAPAIAQEHTAAPLPRLLLGVQSHEGPLGLEAHLAVHGPLPSAHERRRRRRRDGANALIEEVERAGLRGRGGAAFPTARKMRAVAERGRRAVVVANAAEGEPASLKDRTLLETAPHLVLDGGILAAQAVGAQELILCVCESALASYESLACAIEERSTMQTSDPSPRLHLTTVPAGYVTGQESALVSRLNGGVAKPTFTPPMPFEAGVGHRPTLLDNVETLAHVALIARHGADWFRRLGTPSQPGSTLVTLAGPVAYPGVYEIEHGASLASLIEAGGGTTARPRAVLLGGYGGAWVGGEHLGSLSLSNEHLAPHGASLGAGVVLLLSEHACPVAETARAARWLADESAGQCGPCVHGLDAIAATVQEIAGGVAQADATQRIAQLAALTRGRGACRHPDGAVKFVLSAAETFAEELADHARHGRCEACAQPGELPLPVRAASQVAAGVGRPVQPARPGRRLP